MSGVINVNVSGRPNNVNIYGTPNKTSRGTPLRAKPNNVQYHAEHHKGTPEEQKAFKEMHRNWGKEFAKIIANITPERRKKLQEELEKTLDLLGAEIFEPNTKKDGYAEGMDTIFKKYFPDNAVELLTKDTLDKNHTFNIQPINRKFVQKMVKSDAIANHRPYRGKAAAKNQLKDAIIGIFATISDKTYDTIYQKAKTIKDNSQALSNDVMDDFIRAVPKRAFKITAMPGVITAPWTIKQRVDRMLQKEN